MPGENGRLWARWTTSFLCGPERSVRLAKGYARVPEFSSSVVFRRESCAMKPEDPRPIHPAEIEGPFEASHVTVCLKHRVDGLFSWCPRERNYGCYECYRSTAANTYGRSLNQSAEASSVVSKVHG